MCSQPRALFLARMAARLGLSADVRQRFGGVSVSDNPADSLRREVRRIIEDENCDYSTPQQVAAVIRVVSAAARAQAFTEAAAAIEVEPNSHRVHSTDEDGNKDYVDQAHGSRHYAALIRGLGEETENARE